MFEGAEEQKYGAPHFPEKVDHGIEYDTSLDLIGGIMYGDLSVKEKFRASLGRGDIRQSNWKKEWESFKIICFLRKAALPGEFEDCRNLFCSYRV